MQLLDLHGLTVCRLRGHKDQITAIKFIYCDENNHNAPTHILSSSKDTLIKAWDLSTQHCVETLLGHRSEVWSMTMAEDQSFIITGTSDMELKVWKMDLSVLQQKISSESSPDTTGSLTEPEVCSFTDCYYLQRLKLFLRPKNWRSPCLVPYPEAAKIVSFNYRSIHHNGSLRVKAMTGP